MGLQPLKKPCVYLAIIDYELFKNGHWLPAVLDAKMNFCFLVFKFFKLICLHPKEKRGP